MLSEHALNEILLSKFSAITEQQGSLDTELVGPRATLDSVQLVSFLLEVEEAVNLAVHKNIRIISDKALSEKKSPFRSLASLREYVQQLLAEA